METLEDPEKPWILFVQGKIPWKTLKVQPNPEKLCSDADFDTSIFGLAVLLHFFIPVALGRMIYKAIGGGGTAYHLSCGKQPRFLRVETNFQVKRRMKGGWEQADLYGGNYIFRKHSQK